MMAYDTAAVGNCGDQEQMIREHSELVRRIAYHLIARLPASTEVEDLIQSGMMGLLEAARNFDPSRGASFATFAGIRIRGAMIDEVRRHDWTPRSVHQKHRQVTQAIKEIENETGRHAEPAQIAERLGISLDEYHGIVRDSAVSKLFSLDESIDDSTQPRRALSEDAMTPDDVVEGDQFRQEVANEIRRLPEREQLVLSLYYERELNLQEIGAVLGVSESRVCQIHGQALVRLRARMAN